MSEYQKWIENGEIENKLMLVEGWARQGLTEAQISINLGISNETLRNYKKRYLVFFEAIKKGKEVVNFEIENATIKNALGYFKEVEEPFLDKFTGEFKIVKYNKFFTPNATTQIFLLKNRMKEEYNSLELDRLDIEKQKLNKISELEPKFLNLFKKADDVINE
jgi:hypothetical protein